MGCQGRRGIGVVLACALLSAALAWASPAVASTISVGDVEVAESADVTFAVTRVAEAFAPARTVSFATAAGPAVAPADYTAAGGSLSFGGTLLFGETQIQYVTVRVNDDELDEADESFRLVVAGPEVGDGEGVATIVDDDPQPSLSVNDGATVGEGTEGAHARFTVRLSAASGRSVTVSYATADAGATAGSDYTARSGTLTLAPGTTQAAIDVPILDDAADEPAEAFELRLSSPGNATLVDAVGMATIGDDDEPSPAPPPVVGVPPDGTGSSTPTVGLPNLIIPGPAAGSTSGSSSKPALGVSHPRLRRPSTVLVTLSCPAQAGRCSGRVTIFSIPNPRSKIKALRRERRLGAMLFTLSGGRAQTLERRLGRSDLALLRRTGRMRVRAYVLTQDAAGRTGVRSVNGTLIARTAHSSPSRGK